MLIFLCPGFYFAWMSKFFQDNIEIASVKIYIVFLSFVLKLIPIKFWCELQKHWFFFTYNNLSCCSPSSASLSASRMFSFLFDFLLNKISAPDGFWSIIHFHFRLCIWISGRLSISSNFIFISVDIYWKISFLFTFNFALYFKQHSDTDIICTACNNFYWLNNLYSHF